jgi:hypothetical protein
MVETQAESYHHLPGTGLAGQLGGPAPPSGSYIVPLFKIHGLRPDSGAI